MQIFFPSRPLAILITFPLWYFYQSMAGRICLKLPAQAFSPYAPFFRPFGWEDGGETYQRIFRVHAWKKFLPDSGSLIRGSYRKKTLDSFSKESMERFLMESCRAEMTHWLAILPFWTFGLFAPPRVILYMLVYALAVNVPCIIAQRYNRPRILRLLKKGKTHRESAPRPV